MLLVLTLSATAQAAEQGSGFDHFATGFPLIGRHTLIDCSSCHIAGQFKGTPMECGLCHNNIRAPGKNPQHFPTSDFCDNCHTEYSWTGARFDHTDLNDPSACNSCHNNVIAIGMPASHIPVLPGSNCDYCHNTLKFDHVTRVDHAAVDSACSRCHNGSIATGQNPSHVPTLPGSECDLCHLSFASWTTAVTYVHDNISKPCSECHDGVTATGKNDAPTTHCPTTDDCSVCHHSFISFQSGDACP
jgi:hypothetical protein